LIGVISKPTQLEAVEEFLQLFKTPWEFFRPGEAYSVVIATTGEVSNVRTKLLLCMVRRRRASTRLLELHLASASSLRS
jgi:hypothetical protein